MRITIETIPHGSQRYPTVGDWQWKHNGDLTIKVSDLGDWRREALIGIHELAEVLLCKHHGVTEKEVDAFDIMFEQERVEGDTSEPGDDSRAPYRSEHCFATGIERLMASGLGVTWSDYERQLELL